MAIKANSIYSIPELKLTINEKIIPDSTKWTNATSAKSLGVAVGDWYKSNRLLSNNTGKVQFVTLHNTEDLSLTSDDSAQYSLATYNQNMGWTRVHFYVDDKSIWQLLRSGLGICVADPVGKAEQSWHSGDGTAVGTGNDTSLSVELIMNENKTSDEKAKDNAARLCAYLLYKHGLGIDKLVTHTYWVNKKYNKKFTDTDKQCCTPLTGSKWCPYYIFGSTTNPTTALKNWLAFKDQVKGYLDTLNNGEVVDLKSNAKPDTSTGEPLYRIQVGAYSVKKNADAFLTKVQNSGFKNAFITTDKASMGTIYRVQVGAYRVKLNADNYLKTVKAAGFTNAFIAVVNASTKTMASAKTKTNAELAKEVMLGKWGAGEERVKNLTNAGYDPVAVQKEVNKLYYK